MNDGSRKRLCSGGGDEVVVAMMKSCWEGLNPEILALIFVLIPADQMVRTVPLVCKSWLEVVAGPYCWNEIDVEQWCRRCNRSDLIDLAVRKLVRRSKCTFRHLSAFNLSNSAFSFVANCGSNLKVLKIPMSGVTDLMVEKHAGSLVNLTILDISYCLKITCKGIEAFGKQCKALIHLKRNMPPPECGAPEKLDACNINDREAMSIADTMPGLHRLELGFGRFGDRGLDAILTKCKMLTTLDIQGCWGVEFNGDLEDRCERLVACEGPWVDEYDDEGSSEDDSDEDGDGDESSS